jgi:DNA repair exonuclease SbcCD ATPase subunit
LEENRLKKELADIAMALNLEAQKAKSDMNDFLDIVDRNRNQTIKYDLEQDQRLNQTNGYGRNQDLEKRRLSGDLSYHRSVFDVKQRDALRRIGDTKERLESIYAKQRQLNASVAVTEQERRAAHLMSKMTDIENRRSQLMNQHIREKTDEHVENRIDQMKTSHTELETKQHEDQLRYLEKLMKQNEEIEYELRKSVKEAEFQRRKKEQEVQRLKEDLLRKKRDDAKKIHEAIARSQQEEKELERHLINEKEKLIKLQTKREGNHSRLTEQRKQMQENKALLNTHEREHERLLQTQSQSLQSLNVI